MKVSTEKEWISLEFSSNKVYYERMSNTMKMQWLERKLNSNASGNKLKNTALKKLKIFLTASHQKYFFQGKAYVHINFKIIFFKLKKTVVRAIMYSNSCPYFLFINIFIKTYLIIFFRNIAVYTKYNNQFYFILY